MERDISQNEIELSGEEIYKEELGQAKIERESVEKNISAAEASLRELQARSAELESTARRVRELEGQASGWRSEVENLLSQKSEQEQRVARGREMIRDRERIIQGFEKLRAARERIAKLDHALAEFRSLEHERMRLEQEIQGEQHRFELQRQSVAKELAEIEGRIAGAAEKDLSVLKSQVGELDALDKRRAELQAEVTRQSDQLGLLRAQYDQVTKQTKPELEERLKLISEPGAKCPLCQTELGHEKHEHLIDDYKLQLAEAERRISELKKEGSEVRSKREAAEKDLESLDARLKAGLEVRKKLAQAEQIVSANDENRKQLPEIRARLDGLNAKLNNNDFALDLRTKLTDIAGRVSALAYDSGSHSRIKDEFAGLADFESLAIKLRHAEESMPSDEANLKSVIELIGAREKSIAEVRGSIDALGKSLSGLEELRAEMASASESVAVLRRADRELTGRIATLEHSLKRCEILREDILEKKKMLEKSKKDRTAYSELVAAFGKRGVQALIIENTIPEIQEEANRLLSRMTDNAMQVSIETVREKKTGGASETLDIRISDDMGTRNYDLYSGGEAFRINFALRIALSKLLARRSGARLQTLIIDEGFGTQDAKGREKLVEAIDSIKDDFEKILVITHIDELKDAFPTRIDISKDENGSQISVN